MSTSIGNIGNIGNSGIGSIDLSTMDIETALMAVQSQRTNLLDQQLQIQMNGVQQKNDQIAKLNDVLSNLNAAKGAYKSTDANAKPDPWNQDQMQKYELTINDSIRVAGNPSLGLKDSEALKKGETSLTTPNDNEPANWGDPKFGHLVTGDYFNGSTTNAQLDGAITKIKGQIDALSNSQQTDMLRLQSLTNKRNEAFDVMTNFVKKMSDSRSSIIGNMR